MFHKARIMPFDDLLKGLYANLQNRFVKRSFDTETGLSLWCYSESCVYNRAWDDYNVLARGLIIHEETQTIVATPFPKFFNVFEREQTFPNLPFEIFEKLDGSLIIIYHYNGRWRAATKGAFNSSQAQWAQRRLDEIDLSALEIGATYLAEAIYPENRIVVPYAESALVMLSAFKGNGLEFTHQELLDTCCNIGWRTANLHKFDSVSDLILYAKTLPATEEGFVIRFSDGHRLKVKGEEYRRIHAMISNVTPLSLWGVMSMGGDLTKLRQEIPEEFWSDFDNIKEALQAKTEKLQAQIHLEYIRTKSLSDKDLGLSLRDVPEEIRGFIFSYRKAGGLFDEKGKERLYRAVRPTGNNLEGYVPSYAIERIQDCG